MLRLVRFILMLAIFAFIFSSESLVNPTSHSLPEAHAWCLTCSSQPTQVPYCTGGECTIENGTEAVKYGVTDLEKNLTFSEYAQLILVYLMGFLALVVVLLIIWAGFLVLTAGDKADQVKKAKHIILYALAGLLIIFLAWSITTFVIGDGSRRNPGIINAPNVMSTDWMDRATQWFAIPSAYADVNESRGFEYYRTKIEAIAQLIYQDWQVDGNIKLSNLQDMQDAVTASMDTFPRSNYDLNTSLANDVLTQIAILRKNPRSDVYSSRLATALKAFVNGVKIGAITAKITATPPTGNAPLTVTLKALEAKDPSGVPIPNENFVWWIQGAGDTIKQIGSGPTLLYTFRSESVNTVNLTITSASRNNKRRPDVLPFQGSQDIKVLPRLANVLLYINGANLSNANTYKITPNQGKMGLIIDASSTTASAGAAIIKTQWDFGNGNTVTYKWPPKLERQIYALAQSYTLKLTIWTNESEVGITKEIQIISQDPIAAIKADKTNGYAGEDFKFQATSSLSNTLLTYTWSVLESQSGKELFSTKSQTLNYKFARMGDYIVRLQTLSAGGAMDTDNVAIHIDSKDPVGSFEMTVANSETPNVVNIDATQSYDPDSMDSSKLIFVWTIDGERVDLDNSSRDGAIWQYTFSTKGNHTVLLDLKNEQGKVTQVKKDIKIDSLLSVKLVVTPKIAQLGTPVGLVAESKEASVFEWNYGDGTTENTNESRTFHSYKQAGTYSVRLTVQGDANAGNSNSISRTVYVTDANSPYALISFQENSEVIEPTIGACPSGDGYADAYVTTRTNPIQISAEDSINTDGTHNDLAYSWRYQGKTSTQRDFSYKFDEIGCFPVMLTVRSQKTGKTHTSTTLVKVENALPQFTSLTVSSDKTDADPVVVNVSLNNASDPDGVIVSYLWYYYTDSDPTPQDFRITRSPKTVFVVPRINGSYFFGVTMEDSNGARVNSEEAREERYPIKLASDNINTPLINLKAPTSEVKAGDTVTFKATVKNILDMDITNLVEYKWDFDGDGFYDQTTKDSAVDHVYEAPGVYNMKVKASYKGISNVKYQQIVVRNELVPNLEYFAIGNRYVFMNTTSGLYTKAKWTLGQNTSDNLREWVVNLADDEEATEVTLEVSDGSSTKTTTVPIHKNPLIENRLKNSNDPLLIMSYPALSDDTMTIDKANDPAYIYLGESKGAARYAIDTDIKTDSDLNGDPADDADNKGTDSFATGAPFYLHDLNSTKERTIRITILDASGKKIASKDIKLVLSYVDGSELQKAETASGTVQLTDAERSSIEQLKDLIRTKAPDDSKVKLLQYVSQMQENWSDVTQKTKIIIDLQQAVSELAIQNDDKNKFLTILDNLLLSDSEAKDDIALATSVLRKLIPTSNPHYEEIFGKDGKSGLVGEILGHPTNTDLNKQIAEKILKYIKDDPDITDSDKLILKEQLRVIISGGVKNEVANNAPAPTTTGTGGGILAFLLNVLIGLGWIIGIVILAILLLFVFFKITNKNDKLGFQDFIIDKVFGRAPQPPVKPTEYSPVAKPTVTPADTYATQPKPYQAPSQDNVLGNVPQAAPYSPPRDVFAAPELNQTETPQASEDQIPDWLKSTTDRLTQETPAEEPTPSEVSTPEEPVAPETPIGIPETPVSEPAIQEPVVTPETFAPELAEMPETAEMPSESIEPNPEESETPVEIFEPSVAEPIEQEPTIPEPTKAASDLDIFDDEALEAAAQKEIAQSQAQPPQDDLPDWLRSMSTEKKDAKPASKPEKKEPKPEPETKPEPKSETEVPAPSEESTPSESSKKTEDSTKKPPTKKPPSAKPKINPTASEISPTANTDDLPDWLK